MHFHRLLVVFQPSVGDNILGLFSMYGVEVAVLCDVFKSQLIIIENMSVFSCSIVACDAGRVNTPMFSSCI